MNKIFAVFIFSAVLFSANISADEASHRKAILEYFKITNQENTYNRTLEVMVNAQIKQAPQLAAFRDTMMEFFKKYVSWEVVQPKCIEIFMQAFTENEIKDITAFYSTPTGRKFAQAMPELMTKLMAVGQDEIKTHQAELIKMIQDKSRQLQNAAQSKTPAETPANE